MIGITGLIGWYAQNQTLLHLLPAHVPIYHNTSLGFLLCGIGLLSGTYKKIFPGMVVGVFIIFSSLFALLVYYKFLNTGWIFSITDITLPKENNVYTDALFRYIAFSFLLCGMAILCMSITTRFLFRPLVLGVLGILIAGRALVASFSYVSGIHFPVFGEEGMDFNIILGFGLIGVGVIAQAFQIEKTSKRTLHRWLPSVVLTGALFLTIVLWQAMLEESRETIDRTTNITARSIEREIENKAKDRVGALERMGRRWEIWGRPEKSAWESDAALYIKHYPGIMILEWIDSDFQIQWQVNSDSINHEYVHHKPSDHHLEILKKSFDLRKSMISKSDILFDQRQGFYICVPVFVNDKFDGFISAYVNSNIFFDLAIHNSYLNSYSILISDDENIIFGQQERRDSDIMEWTKEFQINQYGVKWNVKLWPGKQLRADLVTPLPKLVLSIGVLLAILLAFTTYLAQTARKKSREVVESQKNLEFLVQASRTMNTSLDYHITLENLAKLTIPGLADICTVFVRESDNNIRLVSVAHRDPAVVERAGHLKTRYEINRDIGMGIQKVISEGKAELFADITNDMIPKITLDDDHCRFITDIGPKSGMVVPLLSRGKVLGAITFGLTDGDRRYTGSDLKLAEDLALRAAQAVDNAKLYSEARLLNEELETRVNQRTSELAIANRELEAFSYSVSHDLRAPLRHVSGFVDLLKKHAGKSLDEKGNRYIRTIADSAVRMGMLIDDLLSFSRMSRAEVKKSSFKVADLVQEIIKDLQTETRNRKVLWKIDTLPEIYADRSMIKQAYSNLLSNAVKYSRPRKEAVIEIGFTKNEFFVRDNGVGFDMKYYNKLFGVFQRLHTDSEFEGTGIGLANVRRIIHRHGGTIRAESAPDKGTTFYFSLAEGEGDKHDG